MARAFTVRGKGADQWYAARLIRPERAVPCSFSSRWSLPGSACPADSAQPGGGDEFDAIVAGRASRLRLGHRPGFARRAGGTWPA